MVGHDQRGLVEVGQLVEPVDIQRHHGPDQRGQPAGLDDAPDLAAALIEGSAAEIAAAARTLAARPGAIVPLQAGGPQGYMLDWLLEEVSVSINTTAAGGNASLMALA